MRGLVKFSPRSTLNVFLDVVQHTGCSSALNAAKIRPDSFCSYPTWDGALTPDEFMDDYFIKCYDRSYDKIQSERLHGVVGWVVPLILDSARRRKRLPRGSWVMYLGAKPVAIMWGRAKILLSDDPPLPTYMLDPNTTCDQSWMHTQNVSCLYDRFSKGDPPKKVSTYLPRAGVLTSNGYRPCTPFLNGENGLRIYSMTQSIVNPYQPIPPCPAEDTGRESQWNPEYSKITVGQSPWESARRQGFLWPTAERMFGGYMECLLEAKQSRGYNMGLVGGNYGVEYGAESCRAVTYVQTLMQKNGWKFDKPHYVTFRGVRVYYSCVPWICHSPQHGMNPVGGMMMSRRPITWQEIA